MKRLRIALLALMVLAAGVFASADAQTLVFTLDMPALDAQQEAYFGASVAVGDVNGDGRADIVVGVPYADVDGGAPATDQGRVYVFSGVDGSLLFSLDTQNPQASALFGYSVAVGDVNGDGKADIAVGAIGQTVGGRVNQGRAYVFSGPDGDFLFFVDTQNPQAGAAFGYSVAVGDVYGDAKADIVVGAPGETVGGNVNQGRAYVFSGPSGSPVFHLTTRNPQTSAFFGNSLALGDVNGDGVGDIAVGASAETVGGNGAQGRAYVFGGDSGSYLFTLNTPNPQANSGFAYSLAAGDVNGDGAADIVVGARWENAGGNLNQGRVYVFAGGTQVSLLRTLTTPNPQNYAFFGDSVAVGDVDADGKGDIAVGAVQEDAGNAYQGRAYVFSGPSGLLLSGFTTPNPEWGALFGDSVAVGRVNADSKADIAVGATHQDVDGNLDQGRAYVVSPWLPLGSTDRYYVEFRALHIWLDGQDQGDFVGKGTATVVRGDPYWNETGEQCADYHIESLTLTGTVNNVPVEINVGEGLTVPVSSGTICEGAVDFDVTLSLYVEETDGGGSLLSSSPTLATDGHHLCNCWNGERWSSIDCTAVISEVPPNQITYDCGTSYQLCNCSTNDPRVTVDTPDTGALLLAAVGGIAEWPGATAGSDEAARSSSGSGFNYTALGGALAAAAIVVLAAGAWLARRRWAR